MRQKKRKGTKHDREGVAKSLLFESNPFHIKEVLVGTFFPIFFTPHFSDLMGVILLTKVYLSQTYQCRSEKHTREKNDT